LSTIKLQTGVRFTGEVLTKGENGEIVPKRK